MKEQPQNIKEKLMRLGRDRRVLAAALSVTVILLCIVVLFVTRKPYKSVTVQAAVQMMESGGDSVQVIDVRRPDEYAAGHIPGAVNVPLENLREGNFDGLPERDRTLLIYCYAGRRSKDAAEILLKAGYKNAYEFGGIVDWNGEIEKDGKTRSAASSSF